MQTPIGEPPLLCGAPLATAALGQPAVPCSLSHTAEPKLPCDYLNVVVVRRGWAWTRALLSLQAPEIHLCGDPSSVELVNRLAAVTGDVVEVQRYERLAPLRVATAPLRGVRDIQEGDCVVAFGRKALYSLKEQIERSTGLACGVIYGSLPPAVRRQQAKAFNSREGGLDVLVGEYAPS